MECLTDNKGESIIIMKEFLMLSVGKVSGIDQKNVQACKAEMKKHEEDHKKLPEVCANIVDQVVEDGVVTEKENKLLTEIKVSGGKDEAGRTRFRSRDISMRRMDKVTEFYRSPLTAAARTMRAKEKKQMKAHGEKIIQHTKIL